MALRRATSVLPSSAFGPDEVFDKITLSFDDRFRRRVRLVAAGGFDFLLDLPEAQVLRGGDGLMLEDGRIIQVVAADEALIEIRAASAGALARLAWHIGNRHLPAEIDAERILIRDDHVIIDMLKGLGASVQAVMAPFNPEGGAYGQHNHDPGHHHVHDDEHDHDHDHDHSHCNHPDHDHGHDHGHAHDHHHGHKHG